MLYNSTLKTSGSQSGGRTSYCRGGGGISRKRNNKTVNKGRNLEWEMDRFGEREEKSIDEVAQTRQVLFIQS